jgi:geranylgeranyl diphosphate synthase type II
MRYSLLAGGKRIRPVLALATAGAVGARPDDVLPLAAAIELIHTYSLIHDDLPAMDDDDYRRGRLTNHKVFGEAMAILAGDALLTLAFEVLSTRLPIADADRKVRLIAELSQAAGTMGGMIGGQVADLEAEHTQASLATLEYIHRSKTAALITASVVAGGLFAGADDSTVEKLRSFGQSIGLAFQIVDDILDLTQTSEQLGKTAGKDMAAEKSTYPALFGIEESRKKADMLIATATNALAGFGTRAETMKALADCRGSAGCSRRGRRSWDGAAYRRRSARGRARSSHRPATPRRSA